MSSYYVENCACPVIYGKMWKMLNTGDYLFERLYNRWSCRYTTYHDLLVLPQNFCNVTSQCYKVVTSVNAIFTARKQSLRRLYFYTCLSVHSLSSVSASPRGRFGGSGWGEGVQAHTRSGGSQPMPGGVVQAQAQGEVSRPKGCIPACTEADTPQQMATAAGSTHPTGMHSCYIIINLKTWNRCDSDIQLIPISESFYFLWTWFLSHFLCFGFIIFNRHVAF